MKIKNFVTGIPMPLKSIYNFKYVLVVIMLLGPAWCYAGAQSPPRDTLKALQIGDRVPDLTIRHLYQYPADTLKLSEFRGKLLILDFWATWCAPCIAMIPRMDSLQAEFGGKIKILSVTDQSRELVAPFLAQLEKRRGTACRLTGTTSDTRLARLFPHTYIPHYVWISGNGTVLAITHDAQLTAAHIRAVLQGSAPGMPVKKDSAIRFDKQIPLLVNGNGGDGSKLIYHSVLAGYTEGLRSGYTIYPTDPLKGKRISARNLTLLNLFTLAYGKGTLPANWVFVKVKDSRQLNFKASGQEYHDWLQQNHGYSYELIAPPGMAPRAFEIMQQQLSLYFTQYQVGFEEQRLKCLALVRRSTDDRFRALTPGTAPKSHFDFNGCTLVNVPLQGFVDQLNIQYLQGRPLSIVNQTGYEGKVSLELKADLSSISSLNAALAGYGLGLEEKELNIRVLIIRDNPNP